MMVGRSPSIARHLMRLCSSAPQKAPKSPYFSRTYLLGKNTPVSFPPAPPASRQDPDPRVPDKGMLQVPARRNPEFGPWNRSPFQKMENFQQGKPSIFPNMEEFNLMKPTPRRLYKSY
ncbi:hypothetical protein F2Q69_00013821 [Brassica cretica]|uniref:Uncharacterized protein n=1 Tax=Brassica cretica TaxID=69181 RepID=A0A8S9QT13_BRACR|nr:hypothetical protein F2Q69_00013821 [Brassica cretica]